MSSDNAYFSIPLYFVLLREGLEVSIVISVLLSFVDKMSIHFSLDSTRKMKRNVWMSTLLGFLLTLAFGKQQLTERPEYPIKMTPPFDLGNHTILFDTTQSQSLSHYSKP